jgi:hypothetical protein
LIRHIHVAPTAPNWFADLVRRVTNKYGLTKDVVQSALDANPVF